MPNVWMRGAACAALGAALAAGPASALTIVPVWGSSITSLTNAAQVEASFNAVAALFDKEWSSPAKVYIGVSWGSVDGFSLPSSTVGASVEAIPNSYNYTQVLSYLKAAATANPTDTALVTAVANLPKTAPGGVSTYVIPRAEMKALGLLSSTQTSDDGYIGFTGTAASFTIETPAQIASGSYTVASGTYDFAAVAAHEIEEVLGRTSGITSKSTPAYRTIFDLFRYDAKGVLDDSYSAPAGEVPYFSINGGVTDLANFNYSTYGGDRGDWSNSGATALDVQNAFTSTGVRRSVEAVDITALDVLGYGGVNIGDSSLTNPGAIAFNLVSAPEPGAWTLMLAGLGLVGAMARRARQARDLTAA